MKNAKLFWRTIPRSSFVGFMVAVFFIFIATGVAFDIIEMGRQSTTRFVSGVLLTGLFAVAYATGGVLLRKQFWKAALPICLLQVAAMTVLSNLFPSLPKPGSMDADDIARMQNRLIFDGIAIVCAIGVGYACFVYVSIREGRRYAHAYAEMALAAEIHHVLVPPLDTQVSDFEFYGRSFPSGEVGGDLIDVFQHSPAWIAYIADVSGHGVAPGVVMGMVKSAARMQLSSEEKSSVLLERLNSVLYPIKKPGMFVTFAYLAWNGERLEFSLAGHPPILQYHAATRDVSEIACSNLPVGMFGDKTFVSGRAQCLPDDLFLLFTDGLLEVTNARDEEFGLDALKEIVRKHANGPLAATLEEIMKANNRHGVAADDRSLLLIRPLRRA